MGGAAAAADTDGDGVDDSSDQFPCDPDLSTTVYVPSQDQFASLLYEDNWPALGDLDFNDAVIAYHYALGYEGAPADNNLRMLTLSFNVLASGAGRPSGLALSLPIPKENIEAVSLQTGGGGPQSLSVRAADANAVIDLLQDTKENFANLGPFVNTDPSLPAQPETRYKLTVRLSTAVHVDPSLAPFDLFFFRTQDVSHEIHRPMYAGTATMDASLFGTEQDGSTPTRRFVDTDGLPFVLDLPRSPLWAKERIPVDLAFPEVVGFASSAGAQNVTWYDAPVLEHIYAVGTGGGTMPVASFIPGENGYLPGWSDDSCFACDDGIQNGYEEGVDCGGSCAACPTCDDGIQNGDEQGVDCGGSCAACATCNDGIQNGDEQEVDCGGSCAACPTCDDGIQNGDEEGVDCGGSCDPCEVPCDQSPGNPETGQRCPLWYKCSSSSQCGVPNPPKPVLWYCSYQACMVQSYAKDSLAGGNCSADIVVTQNLTPPVDKDFIVSDGFKAREMAVLSFTVTNNTSSAWYIDQIPLELATVGGYSFDVTNVRLFQTHTGELNSEAGWACINTDPFLFGNTGEMHSCAADTDTRIAPNSSADFLITIVFDKNKTYLADRSYRIDIPSNAGWGFKSQSIGGSSFTGSLCGVTQGGFQGAWVHAKAAN